MNQQPRRVLSCCVPAFYHVRRGGPRYSPTTRILLIWISPTTIRVLNVIAELTAAMTAIRETAQIAKLMNEAKTQAEVNAAIGELNSKLASIQRECVSLVELVGTYQEINASLKAKIAEFENFEAQTEGYILQDGAKTCEELAGKFGVSTRKVASTLAVVTATGRLARVNQNGKFRYCMPGDNLPAEPKAALVTESDGKAFPQPAGAALPVREAATQEEIKTETVADIVQPLPSFTETQADELIFPSLRRANLALRRAKSDVQKWERVCAALRELNKHRDIVRQITDSSRRVVSEK